MSKVKHEVPDSALESFIQDFFEGIEHTVLNQNNGFWDRCAISSTISEKLHRRIRKILDMKHSTLGGGNDDKEDKYLAYEGMGHGYTNRNRWVTKIPR